jgi:hypothetical protein
MEKLTTKKKLTVVRLYLEGLSYDEIAAKSRVSKGTVFNVIAELKAGRFPEYGDVGEQLDLLRELVVDLRQSRIAPVQAVVGIASSPAYKSWEWSLTKSKSSPTYIAPCISRVLISSLWSESVSPLKAQESGLASAWKSLKTRLNTWRSRSLGSNP